MKTTTTTHLISARVRWFDIPMPATIAIVIFFVLCIAGLVGRLQLTSAPAVAVQPTPPLSIVIIATPAAAPAVQVAAVQPGNMIQRAIVVYGDHDPATAIGAVEAGRTFTPIARYGADWTQVDMQGSGRVFVKTADLYGVPELVDLQPTPAPRVVYVAQEGPQEAPQQAPAVEAAPTMAPALPAIAPQTAAILDRGQWAAMAATARAVQP